METYSEDTNLTGEALADFLYNISEDYFMVLLPTIMYLVFLIVVGLVGNSIVFIVYYRRFKPSATRSFVLAMSVFDLGSNILSLPGEIYDLRFVYTMDNPGFCRFIRFNNSFLTLVSGFLLVAVALDRCRKICRPLHKQYSMRQTHVSILTCAGLSVAWTIPFIVLNGRQTISTGVGNITGFTCSIDDQFVHTAFPKIYSLLMTVTFVICVIIMVVSYARIALKLWRHKKKSLVTGAQVGGASGEWGGGGGRGGGWREDDITSDAKEESASFELPPSSSSGNVVLPAARADAGNTKTETQIARLSDIVMSSREGVVPVFVVSAEDERPSDPCHHVDTGCVSALAPPDVSHLHHTETGKQVSRHLGGAPCTLSVSGGSCRPVGTQTTTSLLQSLISKGRRKVDTKSGAVSKTTKPTRNRRGTVKKIPASTTLMMFVLTVIFIINYLPHLIVISTRVAVDDVSKNLSGFRLNAYNIALRSYFMNCAVNSIVYGFCNARFRAECRNFFSRRGQ